ncbi:MAG TPA: TraI domain-containing protein, partial [Planctomycetota bacterium]|nr:TraI domain-containing protein [Planctomycetota bacterium]
ISGSQARTAMGAGESPLAIPPVDLREGKRSGDLPAWVPEPDLALGMGLAFTRPSRSRMAWAARAEEALSRLTGRSEWRFVHELLGVVAFWVLDLPASEDHHHRGRFGLFDHSLEVGSGTIQGLEGRWKEKGSAPRMKVLECALWSRVAFTVGLLHDIGKVQDLTVRGGAGGAEWDPLREPLALFKRRHGLTVLGPTDFHYRRGRGLRGHLEKGNSVASVLFSGRIGKDLWPFLGRALDSYAAYSLRPGRSFPVPFPDLAPLVSTADGASRREGRPETSGARGEGS